MLSKESMDKEVQHLSLLITEIDLAITLEDEVDTRVGLASARGQLKSARTWLMKIMKEKGWI